MGNWSDVQAEAGPLAATAKAIFDAHKHKTLATLRRDGSPRISGIEVTFADGELWIAGMYGSVKFADLRRDGRFALHSATVDTPDDDPSGWIGDAKLAGRAVECTDPADVERALGDQPRPPGPLHLYRADIAELVVTRVGDPADHLVIESWHEGRGHRSRRRA